MGWQYVMKWWSWGTKLLVKHLCERRGSEKNERRRGKKSKDWKAGSAVRLGGSQVCIDPCSCEWVEGQVSSCNHLAKWGINIQWGSCFHNVEIVLTLFSCRLWFDEFIGLWVSVQNLPQWEGVSIYFLPTREEMHLKIPSTCSQDFDSNSHIMDSFSFCFSTRKQSQ